MADSRPCRRTPRRLSTATPSSPDPLEHLQVIREAMERSSAFTAVSGWGICAIGCTALITVPVGLRQHSPEGWLAVWLGEALLAVTISLVTMHRKAARLGTELLSAAGRRVVTGLLPALVAGALLTIALMWAHDPRQIPGVWLLLYGVAVMQAGAFSVRAIPAMGLAFLVLGAVALPSPWFVANVLLACGFGVVHIAFGIFIARRHGG